MTKKTISDAVTNISAEYIEKAADYSAKKKPRKPVWIKLGVIAACLAIVIAIGGIFVPFSGGMVVSAYAYGTDEEITTAGVVMNSGTISDSGEMKGHPLMFYLSGKDIVTVRFSCKNEQISFVDWTEKRDEYGNAQNFTVAYGKDESEYYYLVVDWVPNSIIRELTDNENSTIATLPEEMRNDMIVMEIAFENGKTATKAITISLLDDGTFFASFDDYQISEEDTFINRPDSEANDLLYRDYGTGTIQIEAPSNIVIHDIGSVVDNEKLEGIYIYNCQKQELSKITSSSSGIEYLITETGDYKFLAITDSGEAINIEDYITIETIIDGTSQGIINNDYKDADSNETMQTVIPNSITFTGTIIDNVIESLVPVILVDVEENSALSYDKVLFELTEEQKEWELKIGTRVQIVCSDVFQESFPPIGNLISITEAASNDELKTADEAARTYYENTVFEVVSLELKSQTENEIIFSVCASKGEVIQEPNRTITLQLNNGTWEVVNEGY